MQLNDDFGNRTIAISKSNLSNSGEGLGFEAFSDCKTKAYMPKTTVGDHNYMWQPTRKSLGKQLFIWIADNVVIFFQQFYPNKKDSTLIIDDLASCWAALAGRLINKRVIYKLSKPPARSASMTRIQKLVAGFCASKVIYNSYFLKHNLLLPGVPSSVVHDWLPDTLAAIEANNFTEKSKNHGPYTLLMRCSLNENKGIREFMRLAGALPLYRFVLLLHNTIDEINHFFKPDDLPDNLVVFPTQKEVASFYQEAHLLVNLSPPTEWTASCDQVLLEAMSYGLPVIAPTIGAHGSLNIKEATSDVNRKQVFKPSEAEIIAIIESPCQYALLSSESLSYIETLKNNIFQGKQ